MQDRQPVSPPPRFLAAVPSIVVGLALAPVLVRTIADPDLWGHVRFGLDMIATRSLPRTDPYSFTQDVPWINHEWLSELVMAAAYRAGGSVGLVALKAALVSAFAVLMLGAYAGTSPLISAPALLLVAWGTASVTSTLRPQLWTLVGIALLCRLLMTTPRRWWLAAVPAMFAAWVNLHGGWIVGFGALAIWTLFAMWRPGAPTRLMLSVAALSVVATLVNPYGIQMWTFLASTVGMSREISEWRPLLMLPPVDWLPWAITMTAVVVSTLSNEHPRLERLAVIALLSYAALRVSRVAPLFVSSAILLIQPTLCALPFNRPLTFDPPTRNALRGLTAALIGAAVLSAVAVTRAAQCISIAGDWKADLVAAQALARANPAGKVVTWFAWGEYALWHFGPGLRVSMDGRRETIYSDAVLADHFALYDGTLEGVAYLERLDPDYVWLPSAKTRVRRWLETHAYRIDVQTNESFVAVREDRPRLQAQPLSGAACFPGGS
jgi:hypothetical protein